MDYEMWGALSNFPATNENFRGFFSRVTEMEAKNLFQKPYIFQQGASDNFCSRLPPSE